MVPVAQWLERLTVDEEVEGSTPFRHPDMKLKSLQGLFFDSSNDLFLFAGYFMIQYCLLKKQRSAFNYPKMVELIQITSSMEGKWS